VNLKDSLIAIYFHSQALSFVSEMIVNVAEIIEALEKIGDQKAFIAGGETIYTQTLGIADKMELTHVDGSYEGDAFFPRFNKDDWNIIKSFVAGEDVSIKKKNTKK